MYFKRVVILLLFTCFCRIVHGQTCTTLGQRPETAFPVCGSGVFKQGSVPPCVTAGINVPGCNAFGLAYADLNPYWYKFYCYKAGSLAFTINPVNAGDDYDWQLFDVTGHNPQDVFTDNSLFVCGNWSGSYGKTGAGPSGTAVVECSSSPADNVNTFSTMPNLIEGHNYLLLVSHFSGDSQSGYDLSFKGGTALITDTAPPAVKGVQPNCAADKIVLTFNKKMRCSSLALDGSDFTIFPALAKVTAAKSVDCSSGFDMDSVIITLSKDLPLGAYKIFIQNGSDSNTLFDDCGNGIPVGDSIPFMIGPPPKAVEMDSMMPVACAPKAIQVVFKKGIVCSTIASDGSDFVVTGSYPVSIVSAKGNCDEDGLSKIITLTFASPLYRKGSFTLALRDGGDGNTIYDECHQQVAAGETLKFTTTDTVSAAFSLVIKRGCEADEVKILNDGNNEINKWNWLFNDAYTNNTPGVTRFYKDSGINTAQLAVTNGVCRDTALQTFAIHPRLKAAFSVPSFLCPGDYALFTDSTTGPVNGWLWSFGNGFTSTLRKPPAQQYPAVTKETIFLVRLIAGNDVPCYDTVYRKLTVENNCYIAVPSAFTPNGDGHNDYLYPLNAYKAVNLEFRVFNRWGQQVFETKDWTRKWDGTINGNPQASGVYVWFLSYTNIDTGQKFQQKGTTVLIR